MKNILIIDDKADIRDLISDILSDEGYTPVSVSNASDAINAVKEQSFGAVILDIWLEGSEFDGIGVLKAIKALYRELPVIMISGHANIETAVNTIKIGAYDFIEKPFKSEKLLIMLKRALSSYSLYKENQELKRSMQIESYFVGESKAIQALRKTITSVAPANSRVLIQGENGVGKDIAARMIQQNSARKDQAFVSLSCLDLSEENFDAVIYGSDLVDRLTSIISKASGGTLYISELELLSDKLQQKMLKLFQDSSVDIRFILSANADLKALVDAEQFSSSLYYRINVSCISIEPLRNRKEDIKVILDYYAELFSNMYKAQKVLFSGDAIASLEVYKWPGNLIEIKNLVERLFILHAKEKAVIDTSDLPLEYTSHAINIGKKETWLIDTLSKQLKDAKDDFERFYLSNQLSRFEGNISKTADNIGIDRTALHRKLKSLNVANN
ncbi:MAG: sigma-54 dependent transcriptional regulator [Candidatus Jidaibacter sp.]|jgi:two-component system nitrogen regulation response regulator NtrX|nr:sigma-54 dependent transcriptional regulator [Candidatus Jidaibacter sp.]